MKYVNIKFYLFLDKASLAIIIIIIHNFNQYFLSPQLSIINVWQQTNKNCG